MSKNSSKKRAQQLTEWLDIININRKINKKRNVYKRTRI